MWQTTIRQWVEEAVENVRGTVRYYKIEQNQPLISPDNQIVNPYFSTLSCGAIVAHNGWIGGISPDLDFATEINFSYLRRHVNIWSDSIKLRYGMCPADSPFLWQHMSDYVSQMASLFDGFRLDNAHSTPIHVCQYLLQVARS